MTTKELADIIGVSRITLSKYLNGKPGISKKTQEKIAKYVDKYDFAPNSYARSLVGKQEKIFGFFSSFTETSEGESNITSHFATTFTADILSVAQKYGYKVLVSLTKEKDSVTEIKQIFSSSLICGAVLFGYETGDQQMAEFGKSGYPVVLINQEEKTEFPTVSVVNMDDEECGAKAVDYAVRNGHRRILFVSSHLRRLPAIRRERGILRSYARHNEAHDIDQFIVRNADFKENLAYQSVVELYKGKRLEELPSAIIASNDLSAIGCINALKSLGVRVPEDVSVLGFDDISIARYFTPSLTTFHADIAMMAEKTVSTLVAMMEGREKSGTFDIPLTFVERDSFTKAQS